MNPPPQDRRPEEREALLVPVALAGVILSVAGAIVMLGPSPVLFVLLLLVIGLSILFVAGRGAPRRAAGRPGPRPVEWVAVGTADAPVLTVADLAAPPVRLLNAEDNTLVLKAMETTLVRAGYQVLATESADEALQAYEAEAGAIAGLISDVVMPGGTGLELAARLRQRGFEGPMLFVTGYLGSVDVEEVRRRLRGEILPKPFSPEALLWRTRRILADAASAAGRSTAGTS